MPLPCAVFFHNYYGNHHNWQEHFAERITFPATLYYNAVDESLYNLLDTAAVSPVMPAAGAGKNLQQTVVRCSSNKGKDIGGKLVLLDAYLRLNQPVDYGLFLHDKKSPYKANNNQWADKLLRIVEEPFSTAALRIFEKEADTGIVSMEGTVGDEYNHDRGTFRSTNRLILEDLQQKFDIYPTRFQYVMGTMFWFRMKPLQTFLETHSPLEIRETLETGNITDQAKGSYTHSWERLLCWIITKQGYKIKTV